MPKAAAERPLNVAWPFEAGNMREIDIRHGSAG